MRFASATSTDPDPEAAARELAAAIVRELEGVEPDLALVFYSAQLMRTAADLARRLFRRLEPSLQVGVMGEGVIGSEHELESEPAVTVVAAKLPGVALRAVSFETTEWARLLGDLGEFREHLDVEDPTLFILLADPFTTPVDPLLAAFNDAYPRVPVVGGMASGSELPGNPCLVLQEDVLRGGAVAVALTGSLEVDVIVSQGCRPVGRPYRVTEAHENVIESLEGAPPLQRIQEMVNEMSEEERNVLQNGLFVGKAISSSPDEPLGRGRFLIRGVIGVDRESGYLAIGDEVEPGEIIQFQIRDARTAREDLEMLLTPYTVLRPPAGGLLFTCNGRGTRLFQGPDGDVSTIREVLGNLRLGGCFCAGEIGPVGERNFLHGHTVSLALFRPASGARRA
jgi:small ligand-binding sensory domain FIST